MDILKPFEDKAIIQALAERIQHDASQRDTYSIMEVCGTHTQEIGRWGLRQILPESVRLISGPGCPVCVTPGEYIDNACRLALEHDAVIATFGDLIRVPGVNTSLELARGEGADIRIMYSSFDAIALARSTERNVVFLGIGFETTIAGIAATIMTAHTEKINNLFFYLSFRLVPPALDALINDTEINLDGFLLPGHVSAIIGPKPYQLLTQHGIPGVISGFEPVDMLRSIGELIRLINAGDAAVRNFYPRVVRDAGNPTAIKLMNDLFLPADSVWRGIGTIPQSGLELKDAYRHLDAAHAFDLAPLSPQMPSGCQCGSVLRGLIPPSQCPLYGNACTPNHPVGPCMVSVEGSCAAYFKYKIS